MKVRQIKELNQVKVYIETKQEYIDDYQLEMLRKSEIVGLVSLKYHHIDNKSNFVYDVSNMVSFKRKFEAGDLDFTSLYEFVKALIEMLEEIEKHLLNPDALVLEPSLIYWNQSKWEFLYLPEKKTNLNKSFHELTEFFVKTLDYNEMEAIKFANFLHKETLQENFALEDVFVKYEEYDKRYSFLETEGEKENTMFINEDMGCFEGGEDEEKTEENAKEKTEEKIEIKEEKSQGETSFERFHISRGKSRKRLRKSLWGDWEDMIVE